MVYLNKQLGRFVLVILVSLFLVGCTTTTGKNNKAVKTAAKNWPTVQTQYGTLQGDSAELDTWIWKAIPYAKPPIGELRWRAPQDPTPWQGTRHEKNFASACPQYNFLKKIEGNEDCLYMNIWRPKSAATDLPVYFWIHGGGNSTQSPRSENHSGASVASKSNMIVVTFNYRLGPLGWFAHPALRSKQLGSEYDNSGNFGTLDIIKALQWVKHNIRSFGGNPDNVFINGESAGGVNVLSMLISPPAKGLFHKAMSQSGGLRVSEMSAGEWASNTITKRLLVRTQKAEDEVAAQTYLDSALPQTIANFLRSKSPRQILECYQPKNGGMLLGPTFPALFKDGFVIPKTGYESFKTGSYPNKVPLILGTNKDEIRLFHIRNPVFAGKDDLFTLTTKIGSDLWKIGGADGIARELRSHTDQPNIYVYHFLWGSQNSDGSSVLSPPWDLKFGSCHGLDVPFFFDRDDFLGVLTNYVFSEKNKPGRKALTRDMMKYIGQFAHTGDPNASSDDLITWKPWTNTHGEDRTIQFNADYEKAIITMSPVEYTEERLKKEIKKLSPDMSYTELKKLLAF